MAEITAKILKGFRDILPGDMLAREKIISTIKEVYESYGFSPLSTPAIEQKSVVCSAGDEAKKQIYMFEEPDGNEVGLIYELTASLSRVMAENRQLPRPFKRYQVQPVWRYDKPDPGRFREFIQFDIDTIGSSSMMADAEIISAMHDALTKLGLEFKIRYSSRKVLNSLIEFAGLTPDMAHPVFRILDKLDKQGIEAVKLELGPGRKDKSGDPIPGLGLDTSQVDRIEKFLNIAQSSRAEAVASLRDLFKDVPSGEEGISELEQIHKFLESSGIPDESAPIDVSIARGLDYYTGPVFEAVLTGKKTSRVGSVMGGGRYDNSIGRFTGVDTPAVGASIGVDRLMAAMSKIDALETKPSTADILVTVMMPEKITEYAKTASQLRQAGFKTELYVGNAKSIGKQLKYADRQEIPIAIIIGEDEFENGEISIKDLRKIKTEKIDIKDRATWVKELIGQKTIPQGDMIAFIGELLKKE
ncbi:MAG: histidine--tRNA ligase [candidate division Zixibacteria bacterium]|nr:histidine--tRNA ligase [candidate division Zixibacteria bacterium]